MSRRVAFGLLLLLAALLPVRAEAARTSGWESNPPASITRTEAAAALASLAPAAAADAEAAEPPRFDLGDVVLVDTADADEERFGLGPLTLVDLNLLRGPPPSYPETRVGGFELLPPFRIGASPSLSLWPRRACGFPCLGLVSDSPEDPWGLESSGAFGAIDRRDRGITNPIAGTIEPEAVAKEAAATAVEEFSHVGIANGLSSSLLGYDFVRDEKVEGPLARILAGISVVPGIPATVRKIDEIPGFKKIGKAASEGVEEVAKKTRGGTYLLREAETEQVLRTGRSKNLAARASDHRRNPVTKDLVFEVDWRTDVYAEQRGREQLIHDLHKPPLDKIEPISPKNPRRQGYLDAAKKLEEE